MSRKILLGTLFIGLIGILVTGAIIRTIDKTELVAEAHGYGHGHDHDEVSECAEGESGQGHGRGNGEAGVYAAGGWGRGRGGYGRGGYGGQSREDAPSDQTGTGQAHVEEWLTIQGAVVSLDEDTLIVQTDSGEQVTMENRPWWFAQEQGFSTQVSDEVTLVGFYENGDFEVGQINDATNGQTVLVRDENGRPLWAGRGRRGDGQWMFGNTS